MIRVNLMTNSSCAGQCIICPTPDASVNWYKRNPGRMSIETFTKIMQAHPVIDELTMFTLNDPFLDNRLFDLMELARQTTKIGFYTISTNASFIPPDIPRIKGFFHELWISFHGADKKSYEYITGLNYENTIANIKGLNGLGLKFQIRGGGYSQKQFITGKPQILFTEEAFRKQWDDLGLSHQIIIYHNFHDWCGKAKKINFNFEAPISRIKDCRYWHDEEEFVYDYTGKRVLCCRAYDREESGSRDLCKYCLTPLPLVAEERGLK